MSVLRRWSEFWVRLPAKTALPVSYTENSVVEALFATRKAVVEAVSGPQTSRRLYGVLVPIPTLPLLKTCKAPEPVNVSDDDPKTAVAVALPKVLSCTVTVGAIEYWPGVVT